ncbi:MAG TPA: hypothetical protein VN903_30990 [Polyangia bacterium]|jgi:hypothetical protein|nr:hypothetical protein [Polyangia bacterium]
MTSDGSGAGDVAEQPIHELSALRDVQPPPALVARVMTKLAEPRPPSMWQWLRRPFPIEIRLSPLAIIALGLGLAALFVLIGANMK